MEELKLDELTLDSRTRAALDRLQPEARERLQGLIGAAARQQSDALGRAVEEAIAFVPAMLRKRVRNMIVG